MNQPRNPDRIASRAGAPNCDAGDRAHLDQADGDAFDDIGAMLADAYPTPGLPSGLANRLDTQIGSRWGVSPELAPRGTALLPGLVSGNAIGKVKRASQAMLRSWPVGIAVAASLVFVISFGLGSNSYAWASVVEAIRQNGLIQIRDASHTDELDLSRTSFVGEDGKRFIWKDQQAALVAFLMREPLTLETLRRYEGVSVVDEDWSQVIRGGRDCVDLSVTFETKDRHQFALELQLDPDSKLPQQVSCDQSNLQAIAIAFPNVASLESSERQLAVVDSNTDSLEPISDAVDDDDTSSMAVNSTQHSGGQDVSLQAGALPPVSLPPVSLPPVSLPLGAANKWLPVQVVSRDQDEAVEQVNRLLRALWKSEQIRPVGRASDLELMRRAYLDLAGRIPTVTEVRGFLQNTSDDRYQATIEKLLRSPDHASQLAAVWRSFLIPDGVDLDAFGGRQSFEKWLTGRFASGDPYDQIVRELLLAEGRLTKSGPLLFYASLKLDADQLAARTSRAFLGMRLECAQCHDHFFEPWSQEDFWSFAAFFAQISRPRGDLQTASTVMRVSDVARGEVMLPDSETVVPPKFLGVEASKVAESNFVKVADGDRRRQLASWLTGRENPYFARATVNRVWAQLFGRGIVDPVDDFGVNNDPVSPELLDALASFFIETDFDLQALIRVITLSDAYQLASSSESDSVDGGVFGQSAEDISADRLKTFAQMNVKTLTAEQLYDCIAVATLLDAEGSNRANDVLSRFGNSQRDQFLQTFAAPHASLSEYPGGIPQALTLMNGTLSSLATDQRSSGLIRSLDAPFFSDAQRIEIIFLATLSRPPTRSERQLVRDFIPVDGSVTEKSQGLADLLWALINSSEFTLNH